MTYGHRELYFLPLLLTSQESLHKTASILCSSVARASLNQSRPESGSNDDWDKEVFLDDVDSAVHESDEGPVDGGDEDNPHRFPATTQSDSASMDIQKSSSAAAGEDSVVAPSHVTTSPPAAPSKNHQTANVVDEDEQLASHEAIFSLLEPGEHLTVVYPCARVFGLEVHEGVLLFGRAHFYILDGYTLINGREIVEIEFLPPTVAYEPVIPCGPLGSGASSTLDVTQSSKRPSMLDLWSTGAVSQTYGKQ